MSRISAFIFALFLSVCIVLVGAVPVPVPAELVELEGRVNHSGRGTWFDVGLGNCGKWNKESDPVVAISKSRYDSENGGNCDQWLRITNKANGKTAYGVTRDSCPGCGYNDLDLSKSLFEQLGSLDQGVLDLDWNFMPK